MLNFIEEENSLYYKTHSSSKTDTFEQYLLAYNSKMAIGAISKTESVLEVCY